MMKSKLKTNTLKDDSMEKEALLLQIKEMTAKSEAERKAARNALRELREIMKTLDEFFGDDENRIVHRCYSDSTIKAVIK